MQCSARMGLGSSQQVGTPGTASIWKLDPFPGDPDTLRLWVEVLTGTELRGGSVLRPCHNPRGSRSVLEDRKAHAPPSDWVAPAFRNASAK